MNQAGNTSDEVRCADCPARDAELDICKAGAADGLDPSGQDICHDLDRRRQYLLTALTEADRRAVVNKWLEENMELGTGVICQSAIDADMKHVRLYCSVHEAEDGDDVGELYLRRIRRTPTEAVLVEGEKQS